MIEEKLTLKRTFLLSILAAIPVALMPLAATGQVAPAVGSAAADKVAPSYKYEAYVGYGYTNINQVNQSRSGLQGVDVSVMRNWGKYFGTMADGSYYAWSLTATNPGKPTVTMVMLGPDIHAPLYGPISGSLHVLLGGAHTGGEGMTPKLSFAGGMGGGMDYAMNKRFAVRVAADDIASSFVEDPNKLGYSPHKHWNVRATVGIVYKF
jgi:hypothetical protein